MISSDLDFLLNSTPFWFKKHFCSLKTKEKLSNIFCQKIFFLQTLLVKTLLHCGLGHTDTFYQAKTTRLVIRCPTILAPLCFLTFSWVLEHIQRNFWPFFNSPGYLLYDSHKNFENWFRNSLDIWGQSWHPSSRNWHFSITMRQKNSFSVTGGNFDLNYLSYF